MKTSFYTTEELNELGFDSIGKDCKISRNAQFYGIQNMNLGNNVRIDDFCILSGCISLKSNIHISAYCALYGQYKIEIGSNSGLSPKTVIYTASDDFSGEYMVGPQHADELRNVSSGKVFIGNYCQLGTSSTVMPGISIEDGAVTGVGTFINKNLAPWGIYIGAPVKFLKQRSKNVTAIAKLESIMNLLHIIESENTFKEFCDQTFDIDDVHNSYMSSKLFRENIEKLDRFDIIFIHNLTTDISFIISERTIKIPIVWFFWGADGFRLGSFYNKFYLEKTKEVVDKLAYQKGILFGLEHSLKKAFPSIVDFGPAKRRVIKNLSKIDYIIPVIPNDYKLLSDNYPTTAKQFNLNYVIPALEENINTFSEGNNLLLGNSATVSNNHIEAIDILNSIDTSNIENIYIPLNYGDNNYGDYIASYASKHLSNINILREFLPREEYSSILNSCEIMIMYHIRQQAMGNIIQALNSGTNIYFYSSSPVYCYLKDLGFKVGSLNTLSTINKLDREDKIYNKKLSIEIFGKEAQHKKVKELMRIIQQKANNI